MDFRFLAYVDDMLVEHIVSPTELIESTIRVQVPGLEGFIPPSTTLAQLATAAPHVFGPHLTLTLHLNTNGGKFL